jgi:SprT-like protein
MNDKQLQQLVEEISRSLFHKPFRHQAVFNPRLRTTGGRYLLRSHNIELNRSYYEEHGLNELVGIIKHELCHYHLHLEGKGYQHKDRDFKDLLKNIGAPRHCTPLRLMKKEEYKYTYSCTSCGQAYKRKRAMNVNRYVCGKCGGKIKKI